MPPPPRPPNGRPPSQSQPWPAPRAPTGSNYSSSSGQGDYPAAWDALEYGKYGKLDMSRLPSMPRGITPPELFPPSSSQSPPNRSNPTSLPPGHAPPTAAYPPTGSARNAPFIPPRAAATPPPPPPPSHPRAYRPPPPSGGRTQSLTSLSSGPPGARFFPAAPKSGTSNSSASTPADGDRPLTGPEAFQNTALALRQLGVRRMSDSSQRSAGTAPPERTRASSLTSQPPPGAHQRLPLSLQTGPRVQGPPPPSQGRSPMDRLPPRMPSPAQQAARAYSPQPFHPHPHPPMQHQQPRRSQSPAQSPISGQQPFPSMPPHPDIYDAPLHPPPPIKHQSGRKSSSPARLHMSSLAPVLEQPPLELGAAFPEKRPAHTGPSHLAKAAPEAPVSTTQKLATTAESVEKRQSQPKPLVGSSRLSQRLHSFTRPNVKPPTPQSSPEPATKSPTPQSSPDSHVRRESFTRPRSQLANRPRPKSQPPLASNDGEQPEPIQRQPSPPPITKERSLRKYKPQVPSRLLAKLHRPKTPSEPATKSEPKPMLPAAFTKKSLDKTRGSAKAPDAEYTPRPSEVKVESPLMPPTPEPELMTQSKPLFEADDSSFVEPPSPETKEPSRTSASLYEATNTPQRTSQSSEPQQESLPKLEPIESKPESQSTQNRAESVGNSEAKSEPPVDAIATPQFAQRPLLESTSEPRTSVEKTEPVPESAVELPAEEIAQQIKKQASNKSVPKAEPKSQTVASVPKMVPPGQSEAPLESEPIIASPTSPTQRPQLQPVASEVSDTERKTPSPSQASNNASKRTSIPPASTPAQIAAAQQKQTHLLPAGPDPAAKQRWPQAHPASALPPPYSATPASSTNNEASSPVDRLRRLSFTSLAKENARLTADIAPGTVAPEATSSPYKELAQKKSNEDRGRKAAHYLQRLQQAENARYSVFNNTQSGSTIEDQNDSQSRSLDEKLPQAEETRNSMELPEIGGQTSKPFEIDFDSNSLFNRSTGKRAKEANTKSNEQKDELNPELQYDLSSDRPDRRWNSDVPSDTDSLKEPIFHAALEHQAPSVSPVSHHEEYFPARPIILKAEPVKTVDPPKPVTPEAPEEPLTSMINRPRMTRRARGAESTKTSAPETVEAPEKALSDEPSSQETTKAVEQPKPEKPVAVEARPMSMMNRPRMVRIPSLTQRKRSLRASRTKPSTAASKSPPVNEPKKASVTASKAAELPPKEDDPNESMFSGLNRLRSRLAQRVPARQSVLPVALESPKVRSQSMSFTPRNGGRPSLGAGGMPAIGEPASSVQSPSSQRRVTLPSKPAAQIAVTLTPPFPDNIVELSASDSVVRRTPQKPALRNGVQNHSDFGVYNQATEEQPATNGTSGALPSGSLPPQRPPEYRAASGPADSRPHPPRRDSRNASIEPNIDPRTGRVYTETNTEGVGSFHPFRA